MRHLIRDIMIVNEGVSSEGSLLIDGETIADILMASETDYKERIRRIEAVPGTETIDGSGAFLIPGIIDDQVHFREPGATWKADIGTESAAAVLGGVTSYMDMPNNTPPVCDIHALENKYSAASGRSCANYSFYLGATNSNMGEIMKIDPCTVCGLKVFMGSSTGDMLVDSDAALGEIFSLSPVPVAVHCEDEETVRENTRRAIDRWGKDSIPFSAHPAIRSREACMKSTAKALGLALKHGARLHLLHVSTGDETLLLKEAKASSDKITAETCVHYMFFDENDYGKYGPLIKCNPSIKTRADREAVTAAVRSGLIDVVATDHAPHLMEEKLRPYLQSPSGMPGIQHSLNIMLELCSEGKLSLEQVVDRMAHAPARCFSIKRRGFLRKGYYADLAIIRKQDYTVDSKNIAYKCAWSPLEGHRFGYKVTDTFVNGIPAVRDGIPTGARAGMRLGFLR